MEVKTVAKIAMKPNLLSAFSKQFVKFSRLIMDSSDDYSFYRGKIFSDESGLIHIDFLVADIDGVFKKKGLSYDDASGDVFYDNKFSLKNDARVSEGLRSLVSFISDLPKPVSTVFFEMGSVYRIGKMFLDPKEPGSYIIYLLSGHSNNEDPTNEEFSYGITGSSELMRNWNGL